MWEMCDRMQVFLTDPKCEFQNHLYFGLMEGKGWGWRMMERMEHDGNDTGFCYFGF